MSRRPNRPIANNLKAARIGRQMSQTKLSGLTGIAQADISALECGRAYPHPGWRNRLASALEVSEAELFGVIDDAR